MKRCDVCKFWIPRTDIGYCKHTGTEGTDCSDCCDLFIGTEEEDGLKEVIKNAVVSKLNNLAE